MFLDVLDKLQPFIIILSDVFSKKCGYDAPEYPNKTWFLEDQRFKRFLIVWGLKYLNSLSFIFIILFLFLSDDISNFLSDMLSTTIWNRCHNLQLWVFWFLFMKDEYRLAPPGGTQSYFQLFYHQL